MCGQPFGNRQRAFAMAFHTQMQCLQSTHREERIKRAEDAAHGVVQIRESFGEFPLFACDDHAPDHVGVTIQVFGHRMHNQVETVIQRALHVRRSKGVVCDGDQCMLFRDRGDRG